MKRKRHDMKRYCIAFTGGTNTVRQDIYNLIGKWGGVNIVLGCGIGHHWIVRNAVLLVHHFKLLFHRFYSDDVCMVLLPDTQHFKYLFYRILLFKKVRLFIVTIDLDRFRSDHYNDKLEKKVYRKAAAIVVQTNRMRDVMLEHGYLTADSKVYIGDFWPILSQSTITRTTRFGYSLAFCGNFSREHFITRLKELGDDFFFHIYCTHTHELENKGLQLHSSACITRRIDEIEGDWGLVWEGDSLETCTGHYREYIKMVFSYKTSLYLAANLPLIVWSQAAIADFVKKNHLGIVVDSLFDIKQTVAELTDTEKAAIIHNVRKWGTIIRSGSNRIELFQRIINDLQDIKTQ